MAVDASSAAGAPVRASWRSDRDVVWLLTLWIVLSIVGCLLVALVWGPHMPPGRASNTAASQATDITVLATIAAPVIIGILLYFGWALAFWRQKPGDETDAAPLHGNIRVQATWIVATSAIVLALAIYGTVELIAPAGAGAGQGPQPVFKNGIPPAASATSWSPNSNNVLQVQVIGQQWAWTFRYPQFGGFETTQLALPVNQPVQFNVTSLDVIHSFWAYTLGVKADANPGVNNVAYTTPTVTGDFQVRCSELCGIWHGAMYDTGTVMTDSNFMAWTQSQSVKLASVTKLLPPYALTYDPTSIATMGAVNTALGLTGAGGGYYNPADPEQP
ncbi:MAG TPA: cytochrome c oxidase subunit II [Trebonia sp.]|jgi:cytochrome c oxidase subunit 2|nr:cytochrome c oxidase subunit II [Trebonia sp.]